MIKVLGRIFILLILYVLGFASFFLYHAEEYDQMVGSLGIVLVHLIIILFVEALILRTKSVHFTELK